MSNVVQFPDKHSQDQVMSQACDWISKLDRGLTEIEEQALKNWLAEQPQHLPCLLNVAEMWDKMDDLQRLSDLFPQVNLHAETQVEQTSQTTRSKATPSSWAVAASICFMLVLAGINLMGQAGPWSEQIVSTQTNYQTQVGQSNKVQLADGSQLTLNTNTFVQVRFSQNARIIELQRGEIHIDVAHDKTRPLSVLAAGKIIQAVGTAFSVQMQKNAIELIVTEGEVLVDKQEGEVDKGDRLAKSALAVTKGQKVDINRQQIEVKKNHVVDIAPAEIAVDLSWRSGNLVFRGESLEDAVAEISRYTKIKIELTADTNLRNTKVAGVFKTGDVEGLLNALQHNFAIQGKKQADGTIVLTPAA
ncbi:hypothetical protein C2869_05040 [Saccharobesus litoralis]|uniref:FecR protein domain-containing protein n=1 Tax=Saccharobesus litoralis TaxID=2172099 RepID=A0A2S0VNQ3_9ALTE|nr:FecR domain-containing protein [Saccharobesus litoralis]AWB65844.1 hypothetical protein C2869_05040 [Saccharobesus litoralis]